MIVQRTVRRRLHPQTKEKADKLAATAGACRFVWNHFVAKLRDDYRAYGVQKVYCGKRRLRNYSFYTLCKQFTLLRRHYETWLQDYSMVIVRRSLKAIETNYVQFFKGEGGLPRFRARYHTDPSFPLTTGAFRIEGRYLHIAKIGLVRLHGNDPYKNATAVSGTIKKEGDNWYAYIVYNVETTEQPELFINEVGIDRNVRQATLSDGSVYRMRNISKLQARKRRYQKMMSRRDCGSRKDGRAPSNRYLRAKEMHARTSKKIKQARANQFHQISREIADRYGLVHLENLNIKGMTASAKGTAEAPGKNVRQKAGLNREILATGWYKLEQCLAYKTEINKVPAQYTSQACNKCGHVAKENRKTQANFECVACGHRDNADINAALNILAFGVGATGRGDSGVTRSLKRQSERQLKSPCSKLGG